MDSQNAIGVTMVYTNENSNVSVCGLVFEDPEIAKDWAVSNMEFIDAKFIRRGKDEITGTVNGREIRWTVHPLVLVPADVKSTPSRDYYTTYS